MAKMFYTLEEAAAKLGKSAEEVMKLAESGQLPEFRDRDKVMFKREQVDLLAGGSDEEDVIPLADSGELESITLASSDSSMQLESPKEQTGISIFDADATEEADPSAVTRVANAPTLGDVGKGGSGSGSGLLDTMREVDDTSLGANLLDEVYGNETVAQQTAVEAEGGGGEAGALFESPAGGAGAEVEAAGGAAVAMLIPEVYDGAGSGLVGGAAIGAIGALLLGAFAVLLGMTGTGASLLDMLGNNFWAFVGGAGGLFVVATLLGWFLGRRS